MGTCHACGGPTRLIREDRDIRIGKRETRVPHEFYRCGDCGEEYLEPGQMDMIMRQASDRIRDEEGLLKPDEIRAIRTKYGLSQMEFERLIGAGPKTVVRWEKGTVFQNRATDSLLRLLDASVENVARLASLRGMDIHYHAV